jgi:hypothetical protein
MSKQPGRRDAKPFEIWTEVAGVVYDNDHGSPRSRQEIIRRFCDEGSKVSLRLEPDNEVGPNAIGLWILGPKNFWGKYRSYQIGYVPGEDAKTVRQYLSRAWSATAEVVGVDGDEALGVTINIYLRPPGYVDEEEARLAVERDQVAREAALELARRTARRRAWRRKIINAGIRWALIVSRAAIDQCRRRPLEVVFAAAFIMAAVGITIGRSSVYWRSLGAVGVGLCAGIGGRWVYRRINAS